MVASLMSSLNGNSEKKVENLETESPLQTVNTRDQTISPAIADTSNQENNSKPSEFKLEEKPKSNHTKLNLSGLAPSKPSQALNSVI